MFTESSTGHWRFLFWTQISTDFHGKGEKSNKKSVQSVAKNAVSRLAWPGEVKSERDMMQAVKKKSIDLLSDKERRVAMRFVERLLYALNGQVLSVILFGSRARGQAKAGSDMDILVVLREPDAKIRRMVRQIAVDLWLESDIYLSTRVWSQDHWRQLQDLQTQLYRHIQEEGIDLLAWAETSVALASTSRAPLEQ